MKRIENKTPQTGSVLIISLIMLVVLTLVGISMIRMSTTNLQLVNNMQARQQALAAANAVINQVLSSSFITPGSIDAGLTAIANTTYTYSPEGEDASKKSYTVKISKPCLKSMTKATDKISRLLIPQLGYKIKLIKERLADPDTPAEMKPELQAELGQYQAYSKGYAQCIDDKAPCYLSLWQFTATVSTGFLGARTSISSGTDLVLNSENGIAVSNDATLYCAS
jgi:fluoride ion exporter CrcB/FEX